MLIQKFLQRINETFNPPAVEACPNCWGYSQWANQDCHTSFDLDKGQQSEVWSRNGFIRRFVKRVIG